MTLWRKVVVESERRRNLFVKIYFLLNTKNLSSYSDKASILYLQIHRIWLNSLLVSMVGIELRMNRLLVRHRLNILFFRRIYRAKLTLALPYDVHIQVFYFCAILSVLIQVFVGLRAKVCLLSQPICCVRGV